MLEAANRHRERADPGSRSSAFLPGSKVRVGNGVISKASSLPLAENPILRILAGAVTLGIVLGFLLCPLLIRAVRTTAA